MGKQNRILHVKDERVKSPSSLNLIEYHSPRLTEWGALQALTKAGKPGSQFDGENFPQGGSQYDNEIIIKPKLPTPITPITP